MSVAASELSVLPLFATLEPAELERLAEGAERTEVPEIGTELTRQGDFGHSLFVVLAGTARVTIDDGVVRELSPGDVFGEVAVLHTGRRTASVVSTTPMTLVSVFKRDVWAIEEKNPAFAAELARLRASYDADDG